MNNAIIAATIASGLELRFTSNDQTPIAELYIEFPGSRTDSPISRIKATAFGNLANAVQEQYKQGDRVICEGRLSMNVIELDGHKEKRAEMILSRIHALGTSEVTPAPVAAPKSAQERLESLSPYATSATKGQAQHDAREEAAASGKKKAPAPAKPVANDNFDEIPF